MIKVLILYYLSLKSTHGYEIQKFIQVNHMDCWTRIQSGSIYYALAKLEKEGLIELTAEENVGAKVRKIYSITDRGRKELKQMVKNEINSPICDVGSDKFILCSLLPVIDKAGMEQVVQVHIRDLEAKKENLKMWQSIKVNDQALEVEKISFEMMISSLDYQVAWHRALLSEIDRCMEESEEVARIIKAYDFSNSDITGKVCIADMAGLK